MRLVPRRKRWWLLIGLAVSLGVGWWLLTRPTELELKVARVRAGMTRDEVVSILGSPDTNENMRDFDRGRFDEIDWAMTWDRPNEFAVVVFHRDDKVSRKHYQKLTLIERLREMWGERFGSPAPF
jgi:SmpA/OmlA family protein